MPDDPPRRRRLQAPVPAQDGHPIATRRVVRERIDPRLTASLFANYRTPLDAILELVDNAVDSRVIGRPLEVDLVVRPGTIVLSVVGGTGMGARELEHEYLRWGGSRKRAGDTIGRYGQGGKAAIGHLGERFEIVAGRAGGGTAHSFADDAYRDRSRLRTYELVERPKPVAADLGYVRIEIGAVDRKVDGRRLLARLAETYRPLLEDFQTLHNADPSLVIPGRVAEGLRFTTRLHWNPSGLDLLREHPAVVVCGPLRRIVPVVENATGHFCAEPVTGRPNDLPPPAPGAEERQQQEKRERPHVRPSATRSCTTGTPRTSPAP